jgi:hypothetical protein
MDSLGEVSAEEWDLCFLYVFVHHVNNLQREYSMCSLFLKTERKEPYMVVHACSANYVGGQSTQLG